MHSLEVKSDSKLTGCHIDEWCFGSRKFDDVVIHEGVSEHRRVSTRCDDLSFAVDHGSDHSLGGDSIHLGGIFTQEFLHVV